MVRRVLDVDGASPVMWIVPTVESFDFISSEKAIVLGTAGVAFVKGTP